MPRALLCGPLSAQGGELPSIRICQFIDHLDQLCRHSNRDSLTGKLLKMCTESMQLEVAVPKSFWKLPYNYWSPMTTESWLKETWKEADSFGVRTDDFHATIPMPQHGDVNMKHEFNMKYPNAIEITRKNITWCRKYLQAVSLSDICTPDGKYIIPEAWNGVRTNHKETNYKWPQSQHPSKHAIRDWKEFFLDYVWDNQDKKLRRPISTEVMNSLKWKYYLNQDNNRLIESAGTLPKI